MKHVKFIKKINGSFLLAAHLLMPIIFMSVPVLYYNNSSLFFLSIAISFISLITQIMLDDYLIYEIKNNSFFVVSNKKTGHIVNITDYLDNNRNSFGLAIINPFINKLENFSIKSAISPKFHLNTQKSGKRTELHLDACLTINNIELFANSEHDKVLDVIKNELIANNAVKSIKDNAELNNYVCSIILDIVERNYKAIGVTVKINAFKIELVDTGWVNPLDDNFIDTNEEENFKKFKKVLKLTNN